ncbi:MAG TPA: Rieske 2Fe-2S domain-containing protein [Kofleriaceae bacterium]
MPREVIKAPGDPSVWRRHPHAPPPGTELGPLDAVGDGREHKFGPEPDPFSLFVVRRGAEAYAYVNVCPHLRLPLNCKRDRFTIGGEIMCSMHKAMFRIEDGLCTGGACEGWSLNPVPVEISADGVIRIRAG